MNLRSDGPLNANDSMVSLTELPPEVLHNVLQYLDPSDLAFVPRVCQALHHAVRGNAMLFKHVYLAHFDKPARDKVNWEAESQGPGERSELAFVHDTVTEALKNACVDGERATSSTTYPYSRNAALLLELFSAHENHAGTFASPPKKEHQMSAKLHCLYGVPMLYAQRSPHETRQGKMSPFACSKVYDIRQYTARTRWGPFMDDGSDRVDWEKVEAILLVIGANLKELGLNSFPICKNFWDTPFAGVWPRSYLALPMDDEEVIEQSPLELQDPYGVTGTWLRVVCFLDYTDFFDFNFSVEQEQPANIPRRAIDYGEATRLILMRITVDRIEPPGPEDGQDLPVVHFKGVSREINAKVAETGTVRLTPEGEVRWTTFSIFNGQERWRSESVQLGGVKSAKGVLGNWFDKPDCILENIRTKFIWQNGNHGDLLYPGGVFTHNPNYDPDYDSSDDLDVGSEDDYDEDTEGDEGAEIK
ncbi:F-box domain-containing protein [Apiospora arundinis]